MAIEMPPQAPWWEIKESDLTKIYIETDAGSRPQSDHSTTYQDASVRAVLGNLQEQAVSFINEFQVVLGCVAWMTSTPIIRALAGCDAAFIVVQKEDFLRPDINLTSGWKLRLRREYDSINDDSTGWYYRYALPAPLRSANTAGSPVFDDSAVRCVGVDSGGSHALMHHKFLVGCDSTGDDENLEITPMAVWTGSFNFTANGSKSLENAVIIRSPEIATAYASTFAEVAMFSEPLDWSSKWVGVYQRIGT